MNDLIKMYNEIITFFELGDLEGGYCSISPEELNKVFVKYGLPKSVCRRENDAIWAKEFKDKPWNIKSKYLDFIEDKMWLMTHKTKRFIVRSKHQECILGIIKYNPRWRQYCFYPDIQYETMWSTGCLTDVIAFMEGL